MLKKNILIILVIFVPVVLFFYHNAKLIKLSSNTSVTYRILLPYTSYRIVTVEDDSTMDRTYISHIDNKAYQVELNESVLVDNRMNAFLAVIIWEVFIIVGYLLVYVLVKMIKRLTANKSGTSKK